MISTKIDHLHFLFCVLLPFLPFSDRSKVSWDFFVSLWITCDLPIEHSTIMIWRITRCRRYSRCQVTIWNGKPSNLPVIKTYPSYADKKKKNHSFWRIVDLCFYEYLASLSYRIGCVIILHNKCHKWANLIKNLFWFLFFPFASLRLRCYSSHVGVHNSIFTLDLNEIQLHQTDQVCSRKLVARIEWFYFSMIKFLVAAIPCMCVQISRLFYDW